uniref:Lipid phosphate phosphatase 2 n=1 Tax=Aegilops tauschii TaxID=37682 RepID=N1QXZ5_AEGTA
MASQRRIPGDPFFFFPSPHRLMSTAARRGKRTWKDRGVAAHVITYNHVTVLGHYISLEHLQHTGRMFFVVDGVLNKIEPFHRFVGSDMLTDLRYPMKDNTVPFWTVPAYDNFTTGVLCHGKASDIKEGHKSFPSGHTSSLVAVSRVDDYRHHWQDVCTGGVLGRSDMDWWLPLCATCNFFHCRLMKMVYGLTHTSGTLITRKGDTQVQPTVMDRQNSVRTGSFEGPDGLETRARFHGEPENLRYYVDLSGLNYFTNREAIEQSDKGLAGFVSCSGRQEGVGSLKME